MGMSIHDEFMNPETGHGRFGNADHLFTGATRGGEWRRAMGDLMIRDVFEMHAQLGLAVGTFNFNEVFVLENYHGPFLCSFERNQTALGVNRNRLRRDFIQMTEHVEGFEPPTHPNRLLYRLSYTSKRYSFVWVVPEITRLQLLPIRAKLLSEEGLAPSTSRLETEHSR